MEKENQKINKSNSSSLTRFFNIKINYFTLVKFTFKQLFSSFWSIIGFLFTLLVVPNLLIFLFFWQWLPIPPPTLPPVLPHFNQNLYIVVIMFWFFNAILIPSYFIVIGLGGNKFTDLQSRIGLLGYKPFGYMISIILSILFLFIIFTILTLISCILFAIIYHIPISPIFQWPLLAYFFITFLCTIFFSILLLFLLNFVSSRKWINMLNGIFISGTIISCLFLIFSWGPIFWPGFWSYSKIDPEPIIYKNLLSWQALGYDILAMILIILSILGMSFLYIKYFTWKK